MFSDKKKNKTSSKNYKYQINQEYCTACGICVQVCVYGCIKEDEWGKYQIYLFCCTGWGDCKDYCLVDAIYRVQ